jgi:class 3 adenylate cyclase
LSENPYLNRGAIELPQHFYGRRREIKRAMQLLRNGQSVSIVGPRKIGKTSLLLQMVNPDVQAEHGLVGDSHVFVYVNGAILSQLTKSQVYRVMLKRVGNNLAQKGLGRLLGQGLTDQGTDGGQKVRTDLEFRHFSQAIRGLTQHGLKIIYLLDEFESLGENQLLGEDFFSSLRSLTLHDVVYVTASQDPLLDLTLRQDVLSSPFFNIFALLRLGMFSRQEALGFIERSSPRAGVPFSPAASEVVIDLVGEHPFCLQVACYHAYEVLACGGKLDRGMTAHQDVRALADDILADLSDLYASTIDRLDADAKRALTRLAQMGQCHLDFDVAQTLIRCGLAVREDAGLRCQSRLLERYVRDELAPSWKAAVPDRERRLATLLSVNWATPVTTSDERSTEDSVQVVEQVTKLFSDRVEQHGGSVIEHREDGVLAMFGVPVEQEDDAVRAVQASLDIQQGLTTCGSEIAKRYGLRPSARIGLNTGVVVVGEMDTRQGAVHTATEDAVDLAERMQCLADPGGIVASEYTYQQVRGFFRVKSLGAARIKGKTAPVKAYRVLGERQK